MLNGLWIKLNQYQNLKMKCTYDFIALAQFLERMQIIKFLSGLNSKFDPIKIQILGKEKLPPLSKVFHIVRGKGTQRSVMLDGGNSVDSSALAVGNSVDNSALATGKSLIKGPFCSFGKPPTKVNRDDRWCSYCKKTGHTKERCFKLHGKEKILKRTGGFKGTIQRHANQASSNFETQIAEEIPSLNKEELEHLQALMNSLSKTCSCSLTMSGKSSSFLSFNAYSTENIWIIDSGATDHMTPHSSCFSSYNALSCNQHIPVVNGSNTPITGRGNIHLQPSFPLKNVLHVTNLSNNLLSIHKITQYLNCAVIFLFLIVFSRILPQGGRLDWLKSRAGYITYNNKKIKSVGLQAHTSSL